MQDFWYREFDVRSQLPVGWQQLIIDIASTEAKRKTLVASSVTSRELTPEVEVEVLTVGGRTVRRMLPWLFDLYAGPFRDFAQKLTTEPVLIAADDRYAVNLNVQRGNQMRYEYHVDSNPIEGLLYVTNQPPGAGGDLVVASNARAIGVEDIEMSCTRVYPEAGKLVFFDARIHPHFVAPLVAPDGLRVVVAMNYYVPSCPESARPADLNRHLGIE